MQKDPIHLLASLRLVCGDDTKLLSSPWACSSGNATESRDLTLYGRRDMTKVGN